MRTRNIDRTNDSNDGRGFEHEMELTMSGYERAGRARVKKVEPPTRTVGGGAFRRIIYLKNPFLDFVGTWTERGGRAIFVEAKSSSSRRLPIRRDNGLTETQWESLLAWNAAGAAVGVVWHRKDIGRVRFVSLDTLAAAVGNGAVSLEWECGWDGVVSGQGLVLHDFLANLGRVYPPK